MPGWTPPALPAQWTWTADLPPWVGRRAELDKLERTWEAVEHGARQLVLVSAEPGAGKSRLVMEVGRVLHGGGVPVLVGECSADLGQPFDPLVTPIRALLRAVEAGELRLPEDGDLTPHEARRLLRLVTSGVSPETESQVNLEVLALGAVSNALASACAAGPVAIVLEDLHWAGDSGLRALRHIIEHSADLPLLVLVTHRDTPPDVTDSLAELGEDLLRMPGTHRIRLPGLSKGEVSSYLTAVGAGDAASIEEASGLLQGRTGGNPFLLTEVWRELRDRGGLARLAADHVAVPGSLQSLVRRRLSRLGAAERDTVSRGAVIGQSFDVRLVRAAAADAPSVEETYRALSAASSEGLIEPVHEAPGRYRFPHALARQAVLEEMEPYALASVHAAVGRALEESGDRRHPTRLVQLAHHFSMAVGLGLEDKAVHYLREAAIVATTRFAHSDAAALLERAAGLTSDPVERDRLSLAAAAAHAHAANFEQARDLSETVAISGDPALRLEAATSHEEATWPTGVGARRSAQLLREALDASPLEHTAPQRVRAAAAYGRALFYAGLPVQAEQALAEALSSARATGDPRLVLSVLTAAITGPVNVRIDLGVLDAFLRLRDRAVEASELAAAENDLRKLGNAAQVRVYGAYVLGEPAELDRAMADLHRVGDETHEPFWVWRGYMLAGSRHLMRCDFAAATDCVVHSTQMARSFGHFWGQVDGPLSVPTFLLRRESGSLESARRLLGAGNLPARIWGPGLIGLYCELGMTEQARGSLASTVASDLPGLRASYTWPTSLALLGEAATALADAAAAEVLLTETEPFAGLNLMGSEFLAAFGSADRVIAGLLGVLGRPGVEDHFAAALEMDTRMGAPLHVATTHAGWAAWLRRTRAPARRVEEHAAPARELADRYGLARVQRLLGMTTRSGPAPAEGLTTRELEVLRLIGRGQSNRQIARSLFISEHTAANHVRSILMKTQSANRTAAAHYARQHGLLGDSDDGGQ